MTGIIKTHDLKLIQVDTSIDTIFAKDTSSPYYVYFYITNGAFYAAKQNESGEYRIIKMSFKELSTAISCAEIVDETVAMLFMHTDNELY